MRGKRARGITIFLVTLLIAAVALAVAFAPYIKHSILASAHTLRQLGDVGPFIFAAIYAAGVVTFVPAAPMTLVAGIVYGWRAIPLVLIAAMIGALIAFVIARYLARGRVERYLKRDERMQAVDKAIGTDGWKICALLRMSPLIPFNLQNYLFGVTRIKFWPYVLSTFLGSIPGTLVFVYLGAGGRAVWASEDGGPLRWTLFIIGVIATFWASWILAKRAKERLSRAGIRKPPKRKRVAGLSGAGR
jgi:uncharacterized membrane protein YdjX (TVP38/TMEM64 family)